MGGKGNRGKESRREGARRKREEKGGSKQRKEGKGVSKLKGKEREGVRSDQLSNFFWHSKYETVGVCIHYTNVLVSWYDTGTTSTSGGGEDQRKAISLILWTAHPEQSVNHWFPTPLQLNVPDIQERSRLSVLEQIT